jgi:hypothetical protein
MKGLTGLKWAPCVLLFLLSASAVTAQMKAGSARTGIFGDVREGLYTNSVFGLEIRFPADWIVVDNEDAKEFMKAGLKAAELDEKELEKNQKNRISLLSMLKKPMGTVGNATATLSVMKQPSHSVRLLTLADLTRRGLAGSPAIKFETDASVMTIGGKEFATFDYSMTLGDRSAKGKYLVTMVRNYSITMFLSHEDSKDAPTISSIINSIKFF